MTKRREDLEFPELGMPPVNLGIGMQDIIKASGTKITRGYCNMVNTMASKDAVSIGSGNEPAGAQPRKKIKRLEE
ncbi:MAG: hypothetical protein JST59_02550 [Actinobacteria bacterium]|nr:hypothetical protein [Actinomycetota bacterium]